MTATLTTSTLLTSTAPATAATPAAGAETPAGLEFQPVLAALTQGDAAAVPPTAGALVTLLPTAPPGNALPVGGDALPLTPATPVTEGLPAVASVALPVDPEAAANELTDPLLVADDSETDGDIDIEIGDEPLAELPLDGAIVLADADQPAPAPETAADPVPLAMPLPAEAPVATASAAVQTSLQTETRSTSASPLAPVVVAGDVKRPLPESTTRAAPVRNAEPVTDGDAAPAAASTAAISDKPDFDLAALTRTSSGDGAAEAPAPSTTTNAVAAALRDNPLRAYQSTAPATAQVEVPVGRQGFSEAVLEKVMWFSAQQIGSAEIHLNPAELGPLSVRISTHQDQASVYFTSHHAAVRDAVDQALPRLREMFDSQGIQLLDAGVGEQRHARQQAAQGEAGTGARLSDGGEEGSDGALIDAGARTVSVSNRLLDAYA